MTVPGRRHRRRRRPARPGPLPHLPRGRAALRLPVHGDRQPGRPLPAGRHAQPGAHRHPARRDRTTAAACCSAPTARCSSAPATPATRRWPPTPTSLAGKVLRIDVFGRAVGASPVYSRGHRDVTALCQRRRERRPVRHRRHASTGRTSSTRSPTAATTAARARHAARWSRSAPRRAASAAAPRRPRRVPRRPGRRAGARAHPRRDRRGDRRPRGVPRRPVRPAAHRRPRPAGRAVDHHVQPRRRRRRRPRTTTGSCASSRRPRPAAPRCDTAVLRTAPRPGAVPRLS